MVKKGDLVGMVVVARGVGLSISETDLLGFSRTTISRVYRSKKEKKYPVSDSSY